MLRNKYWLDKVHEEGSRLSCSNFCVQDVRVYSEEVELDGKDAEQDYQQFKESCDSLATLMSEIQELKANGAKEGVRALF